MLIDVFDVFVVVERYVASAPVIQPSTSFINDGAVKASKKRTASLQG
jgi:hypothetical protein